MLGNSTADSVDVWTLLYGDVHLFCRCVVGGAGGVIIPSGGGSHLGDGRGVDALEVLLSCSTT